MIIENWSYFLQYLLIKITYCTICFIRFHDLIQWHTKGKKQKWCQSKVNAIERTSDRKNSNNNKKSETRSQKYEPRIDIKNTRSMKCSALASRRASSHIFSQSHIALSAFNVLERSAVVQQSGAHFVYNAIIQRDAEIKNGNWREKSESWQKEWSCWWKKIARKKCERERENIHWPLCYSLNGFYSFKAFPLPVHSMVLS